MNWFIDCITINYANFNGRACREEYWMFSSIYIVLIILMIIIDNMMKNNLVLTLSLTLTLFVPNCAVTVRRLHDVDKPGWYFWTSAPYTLLKLLCADSTPGPNQYGENPKGM
ncbi:DUF805 domain-containing protein [Gilliamella sp. GillExp13]|uniref:DUF805 domain-containing protein n=1 Tax=Gilliamella sp. GillExp13 TaxID=3120243 RepID=UPI00080E912D|nr:DUF805 domain-containing protein [Gilliamella apicola]OCG61710.1 hypothetical protein A9G37_01415 [Gilliamella apicola]